jgi:hypothetical protein
VTKGSQNEWQGNREDNQDDNNNQREEDKDKASSSNDDNNNNNTKCRQEFTTPSLARAIALWPKCVGAKRHWSTHE